ncbi:double zinc ribbon domain-containing protein [Salinicola acroporae]|uniref:double zinc ribbon domain-containing protein n=1 Tax=Salinicola acroporae TaxID=1541440 RepID=UPI001F0BE344|nr:double zinc ribbon domain-containing protein [Salinicola acroporae]
MLRCLEIMWPLTRKSLGGIGAQLKRALPGYCAFCSAAAEEGLPWCSDCFSDMPWNQGACELCAEPLPTTRAGTLRPRQCGRCLKRRPQQTSSWVPLRYESRVTRLVRRYKFAADPRAGEVLVQLMLASLDRAPELGSAMIGVPGQHERTRERGFDHTAWLTGRLAARLALPVIAAERVREAPSQRGLDRRSRRRNVMRAFVVNRPLPAAVTIVDDVMTTGATLDSLASACRDAGAERVTALAFARTPSSRI